MSSEPSSVPLWRSVCSWRSLASASILFAAVLTFPFEALPLGSPGIDSGWQWVVNAAGENGWTWGRDVVFTYGPLGWIATPQVGHLVPANAFRIALHFLLILSVFRLLNHHRRPQNIVVFSAAWIAAGALGLRFEGFVGLTVAATLLAAISTGAVWPLMAASVVVGIVPFVKTSLGILVGFTWLLALILTGRKHGWTGPVAALGVAGATAGVAAVRLFPSPGVFGDWIIQALEVVRGYAAAASILGSTAALAGGIAGLTGTLLIGFLLARRDLEWRPAAIVLLPGLLITFRLAFVRQDGHQFLFIPFVVALLGVAALTSAHRTTGWIAGWAMITVLIGSISGALPIGPATVPRVLALGHDGPANLGRLIQPVQTRLRLERASKDNLAALRLPRTWIERLREAPHGVTVIPWELMVAPANDLPFLPLRSMQLYSAYTPLLDGMTAQGLMGPDAPDWVLDDFAPVGKRRALLDAPATWRALYHGYRLVEFDRTRGWLLLRKREAPPEPAWTDLGSTRIELGGPGVPVPDSQHLVFARIDAPLNLFGRLNAACFRVPLIMAVFHRVDGTRSWARLIPATAPAGILVNRFPNDIEDYAGLWSGRPPIRVERFQIAGPGERYYRRAFDLRWEALETGSEAESGADAESESEAESEPESESESEAESEAVSDAESESESAAKADG